MPLENDRYQTRTPTREKKQPVVRKGFTGSGTLPSWYTDDYASYMAGTSTAFNQNPQQLQADIMEANGITDPIVIGTPPPGWNLSVFPYNAAANQPRDPYNAGYPYNAAPPRPPAGPSTFLGGGGSAAQGPTGAGVPTTIPTGSVIGGGGQWVMGSNGLPYYIGTPGPNTFIGAGGEAVRGPDYGFQSPPPPGGGGFGTNYGWGRGRGGRGGYGGGGYGGGGYDSGYLPSWMMGLYSWNFKE
jgi:hypothetical protein